MAFVAVINYWSLDCIITANNFITRTTAGANSSKTTVPFGCCCIGPRTDYIPCSIVEALIALVSFNSNFIPFNSNFHRDSVARAVVIKHFSGFINFNSAANLRSWSHCCPAGFVNFNSVGYLKRWGRCWSSEGSTVMASSIVVDSENWNHSADCFTGFFIID